MAKNPETSEITSKTFPSTTRKGFFVKSKKQKMLNPKNKETSSDINKEDQTEKQKKPFDKKLYRLKKYSKKYKLQQWEESRRKSVLKDFYKQVKDADNKFDVTEIYNDPKYRGTDDESEDNDKPEIPSTTGKTETKPFLNSRNEFNRIKMDKERKREEVMRSRAEKEEALKRYRREKALKYKKLSKRTKKGQPIMKDRMEMLLEKIQKMN